MKKQTFKNSTVLITGASSGIGNAFATQLAAKGANLILTARSDVTLSKLALSLTTKYTNIHVHTLPMDLSQPNAANVLYEQICSLHLSVDYLINSAGVGQFGEFSDINLNTHYSMLMLNMNALITLTHLCVNTMKKNNHGGIINVASTAAFQPLPYQAVYGATKAFVLSFSEALAGELFESRVHVMALCPGATKSRFMKNANMDAFNLDLSPPHQVVTSALIAFEKEKIVSVSGRKNYFLSLVPRFITRKQAIKIIISMFKKPKATV